jgi:hypothetical protein
MAFLFPPGGGDFIGVACALAKDALHKNRAVIIVVVFMTDGLKGISNKDKCSTRGSMQILDHLPERIQEGKF